LFQNEDTEPVFSEPWQAELFAITQVLVSKGCFTWSDWTDHFTDAVKTADKSDKLFDGSAYYNVWLSALEGFLVSRCLADIKSLGELKDRWVKAYISTPHGEPVKLDNS